MNFNNPKVRQRMIEHITFAVTSVTAAIPDREIPILSDTDKTFAEMTDALRNPIIMQVLQFTLNLDNRLKNSLNYDKHSLLPDGKTIPPEGLLEE